jgi:hypothetical protein
VPHIAGLDDEDHIFGDIGGVIADSFQVENAQLGVLGRDSSETSLKTTYMSTPFHVKTE